jgi:hypothetical protein
MPAERVIHVVVRFGWTEVFGETGRDAAQGRSLNWGVIAALLFVVAFWSLVAVAVIVLA